MQLCIHCGAHALPHYCSPRLFSFWAQEQLISDLKVEVEKLRKQARRASGLVGRLAEKAALAQQRAELQLIKHRGLGCLCNLTTRWGCSWSSRHRRPLLFIAGLLIVLAFTVQARESAWGVCGLRLR